MVNVRGEVLLVQEKWIRRLSHSHWKLPGGHTEKGIPLNICICCVSDFSMCCCSSLQVVPKL